MVFQSIARLQQASNAAVSARSRSMLDPDARTSSRVRVADMVLDRELKAMSCRIWIRGIAELEASFPVELRIHPGKRRHRNRNGSRPRRG